MTPAALMDLRLTALSSKHLFLPSVVLLPYGHVTLSCAFHSSVDDVFP